MCKSLRQMLVGIVVVAGLTLAGCDKGPSGKYSDSTGAMTVEFKSGKATMTLPMIGSDTADYTVDGDKVTIKNKSGDLVLTQQKDGSLVGPMGQVLKKKD